MDNRKFCNNNIVHELNKFYEQLQDAAYPPYIREIEEQIKWLDDIVRDSPVYEIEKQNKRLKNIMPISFTYNIHPLEKYVKETNFYFNNLNVLTSKDLLYKQTKLDILDSYFKNINYIEQILDSFDNVDFEALSEIDNYDSFVNKLNEELESCSEIFDDDFNKDDSINIPEEIKTKTEKIIVVNSRIIKNLNINLKSSDKTKTEITININNVAVQNLNVNLNFDNESKKSIFEKIFNAIQKFNIVYLFFKNIFG